LIGAAIEQGSSTPLMEAAQEGHVDLVKFLLEQGTYISQVNNSFTHSLTHLLTDALIGQEREKERMQQSKLQN